jgi:hypothetical protein
MAVDDGASRWKMGADQAEDWTGWLGEKQNQPGRRLVTLREPVLGAIFCGQKSVSPASVERVGKKRREPSGSGAKKLMRKEPKAMSEKDSRSAARERRSSSASESRESRRKDPRAANDDSATTQSAKSNEQEPPSGGADVERAETEEERAERRRRRAEKEKRRREKDQALIAQTEEKVRSGGAVGNVWRLVKMTLGFGAAGWAVAVGVFGLLFGLQGEAMTVFKALGVLGGAAFGLYVGIYHPDWMQRFFSDEE